MGAYRIPARFQRVAATFDQGTKVRLCESSASEHSADMSDLVKSFIERANYSGDGEEIESGMFEMDEELEGGYRSNSETENNLKQLLDKNGGGEVVKENIVAEVQHACLVNGNRMDREFKRKLMSHLRHQGFDAGE